MIKKHYSPNSRQALNVIWNAAGCYDFEPPFLAFYSNGRPDFYFNTIIGLVHKWLDMDKIASFIDSYSYASEAGEYDEYVWLGIESCLYGKEITERPALEVLRHEHAEEFFRIQQTLSKQQMELMSMAVYTQQQARWASVTGRSMPLLPPKEKRIYDALRLSSELDTEGLIEKLSAFLREFFGIDFDADGYMKNHIPGLFKKLWGRRYNAGFKNTGHLIVRTGTGDGDPANAVHLKQENGFRQDTSKSADDRAYIEACFGKALYSDAELSHIEALLCRGDDEGCRLWFSKPAAAFAGSDVSHGNDGRRSRTPDAAYNSGNGTDTDKTSSVNISKQTEKEILSVHASIKNQHSKNTEYLHKNSLQIRESIKKLSAELDTLLSSYLKHLPERSDAGRLDSKMVYRLAVLDDKNVFLRDGDEAENNLRVTLLLDASQSRMNSQELISAEAYVISESLTKVKVPVQVLSFRSLRGYTVIERLKDFRDRQSGGISAYFASGWNRDALAFRAAGYTISEETSKNGDERHILIILTDASPNDSTPLAPRENDKRPQNYEGLPPVEDARNAVKELNAAGIKTAAIFHGSTAHLENVYRIFGKEYIRIRSLIQLSGGVIDLMQSLLSEEAPE